MSIYLVTGRHPYREKPPGSTFEDVLETAAEERALARGDIRILERSTPSLQPGSYRLPAGWANPQQED